MSELYNKEMLDQYGFDVPETWEDMTEIFARLKEDDIFGFATNSARPASRCRFICRAASSVTASDRTVPASTARAN